MAPTPSTRRCPRRRSARRVDGSEVNSLVDFHAGLDGEDEVPARRGLRGERTEHVPQVPEITQHISTDHELVLRVQNAVVEL